MAYEYFCGDLCRLAALVLRGVRVLTLKPPQQQTATP
jgi:hypothetical protein